MSYFGYGFFEAKAGGAIWTFVKLQPPHENVIPRTPEITLLTYLASDLSMLIITVLDSKRRPIVDGIEPAREGVVFPVVDLTVVALLLPMRAEE